MILTIAELLLETEKSRFLPSFDVQPDRLSEAACPSL